MVELVVAAIVLVVIMIVFVFILFKNLVNRMNENAKKYFVNKLQDYDYIINEKQAKLEEITYEINKSKKESKNILADEKNNIQEENKEKKEHDKQKKEIEYNLNTPEYRETQFFNNYKQVKKIFTINNEKIIKDFVAEHKNEKDEKEYKKLKKIRAKFNSDIIYQILTVPLEEQNKMLNEILTETEKKALKINEMFENSQFNIMQFIQKIDDRLEQIDPTIYVYSSSLDNRYDSIDENIVVKQYANMSEGIIIKYRNKIYDYSI